MIYGILFAYEAIVCYIYDRYAFNEKKVISIHNYKLYVSFKKLFWASVIILPLWLLMGLRYNIGADYKSYENMFKYYITYHRREGYKTEIGYYYLNLLAGRITDHPQIIFLIVAAIIIIFFFKGIEKNKGRLYYGILSFIGMGYYFYAMNGQRQYIAIAIMFYSLYFLEKKKIVPFLLCVAISACFHVSAIIWIPVYFAVLYVPTKLFYGISMGIALAANFFTSYILNFLANIGFYTTQITKNYAFMKERVSGVNIVLSGLFMLCGVLFYRKIEQNHKNVIRFKLVWLIFLMYTFMYTFGNAVTRIASYFCPVYFLLIPDILDCFGCSVRRWMRVFLTISLFALMYIVLLYNGAAYLPYTYRLLWGATNSY